MRAISTLRTSRTVIDATTASRASMSLTLLRRMSLICTNCLPLAWSVRANYTGLNATVRPRESGDPDCSNRLRCIGLGAAFAGTSGDVARAETIHELHDRLQVDPRRGLAAGMAGACRSRRLLPLGGQVR